MSDVGGGNTQIITFYAESKSAKNQISLCLVEGGGGGGGGVGGIWHPTFNFWCGVQIC